MDIYVDSSAPIPWRFRDVERDFFWKGVTSLDYVPKRLPNPRRYRYAYDENKYGSRGVPFYNDRIRYKNNKYSAKGPSTVVYFDRLYAPGVTLLGFRDACPNANPDAKDAAILRFFSEEEYKRTRGNIQNYTHTIEFSEAFMEKIGSIFAIEDKRQKAANPVRNQF